jgi:hypothetical protein
MFGTACYNTHKAGLQVYCFDRPAVLNTGKGSYESLDAICVEFGNITLRNCVHLHGF